MWILYEVLLLMAFLLYLPKAVWRRRLPHAGWSMRLGRYPREITQKLAGRSTLWVHAVSVGEVLAAQPLLKALGEARPQEPLVVSTITSSGFGIASRQVRAQDAVVYFPLDLRWCVSRALRTINPRMLLLVESELWPLAIRLSHRRGIPIAVVNGRISPRALKRYRLVKSLMRRMLGQVDLFLMQSQADADRVLQLGAPANRVRVIGSLKWDASLGARPGPHELRDIAARLGLSHDAPVVVAGSTHHGEEQAIVEAFERVRATHPQAKLIIAPRHLERLSEVEALLQRAGLQVIRMSQAVSNQPWQAGLVDTFGQLPRYYGLATAVFIGGSLIPHGGQNPLEAASVGKPIIFGPSMHNFETIAHELLAHHAARQVADPHELTSVLQKLIAHPDEARQMGARAQALTEQFQGATQRTLNALQPFLNSSM